jgi:hypothetical protein
MDARGATDIITLYLDNFSVAYKSG